MSKTKSTLKAFKEAWHKSYAHIELNLSDDEIMSFILKTDSLSLALDQASDYLLASGDADVQE